MDGQGHGKHAFCGTSGKSAAERRNITLLKSEGKPSAEMKCFGEILNKTAAV